MMAGVKGRSGRKSRYQELQEGKFQKICIEWLMDNFQKFDDKTKMSVAKDVMLKSMPQFVNQDITATQNIKLTEAENELIANKVRESLRTNLN